MSEVNKLEDEEHWEKKKKTCGFCKFMLEGPCALSFKKWDICVEKAKLAGEVFEEKCLDFTGDLMTCMEENPDYYPPASSASSKNMDNQSKTEN